MLNHRNVEVLGPLNPQMSWFVLAIGHCTISPFTMIEYNNNKLAGLEDTLAGNFHLPTNSAENIPEILP